MVNDSARALALIISAIKSLRELKGSTSKEILSYLSSVHNIDPNVARRQMATALKRGVAYGILRKNGAHYILPTNSEMKLQEIAEQEVNLLDICRKSKMQKKMGCKCKKRRRRRRRRRRKKFCKCKKKKRRRRRRRRRKKKCKCKSPGSRRDRSRTRRCASPRSSIHEPKTMEMPMESYEASDRTSFSSISSQAD